MIEVGDIIRKCELDWEDHFYTSHHLVLETDKNLAYTICLETGEIRWRLFTISDHCTITKVA